MSQPAVETVNVFGLEVEVSNADLAESERILEQALDGLLAYEAFAVDSSAPGKPPLFKESSRLAALKALAVRYVVRQRRAEATERELSRVGMP